MVTTRPGRRRGRRSRGALSLRVALLASTIAFAGALRAQDVRIAAAADTVSRRVGEQARITVTVEYPSGALVRNVGPADSLRGLEIVRVDSGDAAGSGLGPGAGQTLMRVYTVTAFDTGMHVVPPFVAWYTTPSDTTVRRASGLPVTLHFRGVEVDTSAEIRAIKPPLDVPLTFAELLPYAVGIIAAALLAWLVVRLLKKRKRGEAFIPGPPPRPEDEVALEALRSIGSERLWQRGKVKEYHTALSDVLRAYIERRFDVPAMESTSGEILGSGPVSGLGREPLAGLRDLLLRSDLVKFAKFIPAPEENERSFSGAVTFVETTRRKRGADMTPASDAAAGSMTAGAGERPDDVEAAR